MNPFLEWVDWEGGIWDMTMHGWSDDQLYDLGMTPAQVDKANKIAKLIGMADELWRELQTELENQ